MGLVIILYGAPNMIYHGALRSDASAKTGMVGKLQSLLHTGSADPGPTCDVITSSSALANRR